jgi:nicotinamidase-related amidase
MRILLHESAALMIDIQEKLFPHMQDGEKLLANCLKLTEGLQILSVPVIVTQQYTKGLGETLAPLKMKFDGFTYFEKISFSCADDQAVLSALENAGRKNIIIYGIEAHVCVLQTCFDLIKAGFIPVVAEDCISSRKINDKLTAVGRMRQDGAVITTMESILFELTRKAGTDIFRKISAIVK